MNSLSRIWVVSAIALAFAMIALTQSRAEDAPARSPSSPKQANFAQRLFGSSAVRLPLPSNSVPSSSRVPATRSPRPTKLPPVRTASSRKNASRPDSEASLATAKSLGILRLASDRLEDEIPIEQLPDVEGVQLDTGDDLVTLIATGADLPAVLRMIADHHDLNLVLGPGITGPVTVSIREARLDEVLDAILGVAGFHWHRVDNLLYVTGNTVENMDPRVQGRVVQVYSLNFVAAADVEPVVNGLLSAVGKVFVTTADPADSLRTRESIIVEDTLDAHRRIAQFLAQVDTVPQQVLIEAHVLQITLDDDERHGVNLTALARLGGTELKLSGTGFADTAANPSLAFSIDGTDMDSLLECIRSNTNARTLASPKVSVVNHQESKIQIGERLPYTVATTTQTTTVQSVEFLEVGIVLTVRPVIGNDGNVMMTVLPKVSGGKITGAGFPEEETTEVSTTIMVPDGGGIVIGGLIREEEVNTVAAVPGISRVPMIGKLFRRTTQGVRRTELVIALVAHVLPCGLGPRPQEWSEVETVLPPYARAELRHGLMQPSGQSILAPVHVLPVESTPGFRSQPVPSEPFRVEAMEGGMLEFSPIE